MMSFSLALSTRSITRSLSAVATGSEGPGCGFGRSTLTDDSELNDSDTLLLLSTKLTGLPESGFAEDMASKPIALELSCLIEYYCLILGYSGWSRGGFEGNVSMSPS